MTEMMDNQEAALLTLSNQLISWCRDSALPVWTLSGRDIAGRFVEMIRQDGVPDIDARRRVRVQFRQVFAFAQAYELGLAPGADALARQGMERALGDAFDPEDRDGLHGCALWLDPTGAIADPTRDLYTQAFYLLALSSCHRLGLLPDALARADRQIAFLESRMASEFGGYLESIPAALPRRQNPHMHLFEAFLALHEAAPDRGYLQYADKIFALFENHFFDRSTGCLLEYFTKDWQAHPQLGHRIEPGHMMEWAWLIHHYGRLSGLSIDIYVRTLYDTARHIGVDFESGLLVDEVAIDGTPLLRTRRSWPQTEYTKAALVLAGKGDGEALATASKLISTLCNSYLATGVKGLWYDSYDADGLLTDGPASASTFYHYMTMIAEVARFTTASQQLESSLAQAS